MNLFKNRYAAPKKWLDKKDDHTKFQYRFKRANSRQRQRTIARAFTTEHRSRETQTRVLNIPNIIKYLLPHFKHFVALSYGKHSLFGHLVCTVSMCSEKDCGMKCGRKILFTKAYQLCFWNINCFLFFLQIKLHKGSEIVHLQ